MVVATIYNGKFLLGGTNNDRLQLSDDYQNPCCCDNCSGDCPQPVQRGQLRPESGWFPREDDGTVSYSERLPLSFSFGIEASLNCGGSNSSPQSGSLSCSFYLPRPARVRLFVSGTVERQNAPYDYGTLTCGGVTAQIQAIGAGAGCSFQRVQNQQFVELDRGCHAYTMSVNTGDGLYHTDNDYVFIIDYA
jgi:hypothetical protein